MKDELNKKEEIVIELEGEVRTQQREQKLSQGI